jgi:hypothetical protein
MGEDRRAPDRPLILGEDRRSPDRPLIWDANRPCGRYGGAVDHSGARPSRGRRPDHPEADEGEPREDREDSVGYRKERACRVPERPQTLNAGECDARQIFRTLRFRQADTVGEKAGQEEDEVEKQDGEGGGGKR